MKNLQYYLELPLFPSKDGCCLSLIHTKNTDGKITRNEIDLISQHPLVTEISISGLIQDTFEYFIQTYGKQFKAINFWKCPLINDLSILETLTKVEYIGFFWNQRCEQLWDFSKTTSLKGFGFDDFTRMHDISQISYTPCLEDLHFGDKIWDKYILNTLEPLQSCQSIKNLSFSAKKILDGKIEPISFLKNLETLEFSSSLFTVEQIAWLKAHLPKSVNSNVLTAVQTRKKSEYVNLDTLVNGKRKPFLDSTVDYKRIQKYKDEFEFKYHWFLENTDAAPEDWSNDN